MKHETMNACALLQLAEIQTPASALPEKEISGRVIGPHVKQVKEQDETKRHGYQ